MNRLRILGRVHQIVEPRDPLRASAAFSGMATWESCVRALVSTALMGHHHRSHSDAVCSLASIPCAL